MKKILKKNDALSFVGSGKLPKHARCVMCFFAKTLLSVSDTSIELPPSSSSSHSDVISRKEPVNILNPTTIPLLLGASSNSLMFPSIRSQ